MQERIRILAWLLFCVAVWLHPFAWFCSWRYKDVRLPDVSRWFDRAAFHARAVAALPPIGGAADGRRSVYPSLVQVRTALGRFEHPLMMDLLLELPPSPRRNLVDALHGADLRVAVLGRMHDDGFPSTHTPDSTWKLAVGAYSGGPRPHIVTSDTPSGGSYDVRVDRIEVNVTYPTSGEFDPVIILSHELGHGMQHPLEVVGRGAADPVLKAYLEYVQRVDPNNDAAEVAQSLADVCLMGEAHRLHTGRELAARVALADEYRPLMRWLTAQSRIHGLYSGRVGTSITELLATPSGLRWIQLLLERSVRPVRWPFVGPA